MSRKSVLIAQLAEDEAIKDAFRQFAARIVGSSKLSSKTFNPLDSYMNSALNSNSDEDQDIDEESGEELCECKCQRIKHKTLIKEMKTQLNVKIDDENGAEDEESDEKVMKNNTQNRNNNNNHTENCDCVECKKAKKLNENGIESNAGEDKKKKKSEKKKLKKKMKKEKKKAEKLSNESETVDDCKQMVSNEVLINRNIERKHEKSSNKSKKKSNSSGDNHNCDERNSKTSANRESEKLSPKYELESDLSAVEAEEEELSFSSAYVSQIAQRKSKPSKSAQIIIEAQDYGQFDDSLKYQNNYSNYSNSSSFSNNYSTNKPIKEINEELPKMKTITEQKQKPSKIIKEDKAINIDKSIEYAISANQRAESLKFNEAIDLFTKALSCNPNDYRFYVNRSYCYDSIQDFRSALKDAEKAIQLRTDWPKCHYRKGKALAGLKNYHESEIALKKVLSLENDCDEALTELWHVRYGAIVDMGYDPIQANVFASQYDSIKEALDALSLRANQTSKTANKNDNQNGLNAEIWADDDIYISDDEYNAVNRENSTYEETSPTNPFGWKALWIGNVSLNAKLDTVTTMFRKFGNLNYCNIFKGNNGGNFILVHYDNSDSPRLAMTKYQGKVIPGVSISDTALTIRFRPNKDQKKPSYDQRLESDECYYWRTTGCARGNKCMFKHINANKGVDKQAWMCNPLKKNFQSIQKSQK